MSADLHLHAMDTLVEQELAEFFAHSLGSKHFDITAGNPSIEIFDRVAASPNVWIGEVSWLKYAVTSDRSYLPDPVVAVSELIGEERPRLTEELAGRILGALRQENRTPYRVARPEEVEPWLITHMGSRLFTVSW